MRHIEHIRSNESPRKILAADFRSLGGELPISGGWGYTKEDACIINKFDSAVDPKIPFNGVEIEYIFVEKRIYEEMIIFRSDNEKFSGISWKLSSRQTLREKDSALDKLIFNVTAFTDQDWNDLKAEYEGPNGYGNPRFDLAAHLNKRSQKTIRLSSIYWFDITSFYGDGVVVTDKSTGEKRLLPPDNFGPIEDLKKYLGKNNPKKLNG